MQIQIRYVNDDIFTDGWYYQIFVSYWWCPFWFYKGSRVSALAAKLFAKTFKDK